MRSHRSHTSHGHTNVVGRKRDEMTVILRRPRMASRSFAICEVSCSPTVPGTGTIGNKYSEIRLMRVATCTLS